MQNPITVRVNKFEYFRYMFNFVKTLILKKQSW